MPQHVVVTRFGGPNELQLFEDPVSELTATQVCVRLTSIGLNHADLMARRGEYKLYSGSPPFTPGLEGGGVIEAVGSRVTSRRPGQRVILDVRIPRPADGPHGGTYRSHIIAEASMTIPLPDEIADEQAGALWLTYLTAWGCLIWKQNLQAGQIVAIPAASSGVGLAAAQIVRQAGAIPIGLTSSASKLQMLQKLPESEYEHLILAERAREWEAPQWHRELLRLTDGKGVDVFFDPVAAGGHLHAEIRALAQHGTIWIYGLLGKPGSVDLSPLIRKHGAVRGWVLGELASDNSSPLLEGYSAILHGFAKGHFRQHISQAFPLQNAAQAHQEMEKGLHIGKIILTP